MVSNAEHQSHPQKQIKFYVNGKLQTNCFNKKVTNEYPLSTSLNYYLRDVLKLTGTKVFCHEGGCGCCTVNATEFDQTTREYRDISVNSCLFPLYSCDGYSFTTVEGIGNKKTGLHPIQKRLADANGSQCGFCSPGFVMSMYSTLKNNPKPTKEEIENSFDGNICRCTGYRAILDAMKSFAVDENPIDIEDLKSLKCLNGTANVNGCNETHKVNGCRGHGNDKACDSNQMFQLVKDNKEWYSPENLNDLKQILTKNQTSKYRLIFGNTSIGVFKKQGPFDGYINIKTIKELYQVKKQNESLTIGSNVTLTKLMEIFKQVSKENEKMFGHLNELGKCFEKVANVHIKNTASWAGNLAMKKEHLEFPSDVLVILESAGAKLNIYNPLESEAKSTLCQISLSEFLNSTEFETNKYLIESMILPAFDQQTVKIKYYKVSPRAQNSHAYINCGLRFNFETVDSTKLISKPLIIFNGISDTFYHASKTEEYLDNKDLSDNDVLAKSIEILTNELNSSGIHEIVDPLLSKAEYRISLALSLFYKFLLSVNTNKTNVIKSELKSAIESIIDCRSVSKSEQIFDSKHEMYPVTKPLPKLNAYSQTSGETKYIDDLSELSHQTHGAFILSTVANANIESIDIEKAMKVPGVINIYLAKDIPGENNIMPKPFITEPLFADKEIFYCGQAIGLVVADTHVNAKRAAKMVKVNYTDVKKPILNIHDAIKENSYHPKPMCGDLIKGDATTAIKDSKHQLSGECFFDASQFNFFLEGVIGVCEPTEDGYKIECTTQWIDSVQRSVAMVLGIENSSCIDVQVKQLGGSFGGKTTRGNLVATAAAVASHDLRRPVKIHMDLNDCMDMIGKRPPWYIKYSVGFDDDGKLNGIDYDWYSDPGFTTNGSLMFICYYLFESSYKCPNYFIKSNLVKTNKPASTEVRSPDIMASINATEQVLEHVANYLNKDPLEVRKANFFQKDDITSLGHALTYIDIDKVINDLKDSSEFYKRKQDVEEFNKVNTYKKKGIALLPMRYCLTYNFGYYNALVSIRHHDGSVSVSHGGIEMGQGLHTKVAQVCAYELGIPVDKISVKSTNNLINPNGLYTGGSVTSELCCKSVIESCRILKNTLEPIKKLMNENYTWNELVSKAFSMNCNLSAMYLQKPPENITDMMTYDIDAAACSEVLIDVLTGETQILRTDILYDCGQTINGLIDVGQAEGGFVMGLGFMLMEKTIYDPITGKCLNNGTWDYKPPLAKDIPMDFRIKFVENKPNPVGVLGSKATGEPPLVLSNSVLFAIRHAIASARKDRGVQGHFRLDLPVSVDCVQQACLVDPNEFKLN